jgi:hypothetical protein
MVLLHVCKDQFRIASEVRRTHWRTNIEVFIYTKVSICCRPSLLKGVNYGYRERAQEGWRGWDATRKGWCGPFCPVQSTPQFCLNVTIHVEGALFFSFGGEGFGKHLPTTMRATGATGVVRLLFWWEFNIWYCIFVHVDCVAKQRDLSSCLTCEYLKHCGPAPGGSIQSQFIEYKLEFNSPVSKCIFNM